MSLHKHNLLPGALSTGGLHMVGVFGIVGGKKGEGKKLPVKTVR